MLELVPSVIENITAPQTEIISEPIAESVPETVEETVTGPLIEKIETPIVDDITNNDDSIIIVSNSELPKNEENNPIV